MSYEPYANEPDAPTFYEHGEGNTSEEALVVYVTDLNDYLEALAKAAGDEGFVEESAAYQELVARLRGDRF